MSEQGQHVYNNAQSIEQLGKAFQSMSTEDVTIPQRNCQDVPEFIRRLQSVQDATRNHSIQFG